MWTTIFCYFFGYTKTDTFENVSVWVGPNVVSHVYTANQLTPRLL